MLKFYLATVIAWMIILYCLVAIFQNGIIEKLGTDNGKKKSSFEKLKTLFVMSAVPVVRLLVAIMIVYIAACKKEDFDELMKKSKNN